MSSRSAHPPGTPEQEPVPLSPVTPTPRRAALPSFLPPERSRSPTSYSLSSTPSPTSPQPPDTPPPSSHTASFIVFLTSLLPPGLTYFISQNIGLAFVASAQLFFVLMGLTVKYFLSTTRISTATLIFVRMGITSICCVFSLWAVKRDANPILGPPGIRSILALRGLFGWVGLLAGYQALRGLTLSDSLTIQFLAPSVTALLGYLFLKENMSRREVLAGACCLLGVILVSRPPFLFGGAGGAIIPPEDGAGGGRRLDLPLPPGEGDQEGVETPERSVAVTWAFAAVFASAFAYTTIRWIGNKAHALHSIAYFSYMCTITCGLWLLVDPEPLVWVTSVRDFLFIIAIGIFGFCAQTFLTMGLQREKAGRAGLAIYLQVVFALVFEFLIWQTIPSFLSALGTAIILVSAFWAALSTTPQRPNAKPTDPEAMPFSRTPSPIPPPLSDRPSLRAGEHYSYDSVPTMEVLDAAGGLGLSTGKGSERVVGDVVGRKGSVKRPDGLLGLPGKPVPGRHGSESSVGSSGSGKERVIRSRAGTGTGA
ncbi:hypothetical protein IAT38_004179 [Cryptococcus sp. DSM 104549]